MVHAADEQVAVVWFGELSTVLSDASAGHGICPSIGICSCRYCSEVTSTILKCRRESS